MQTNSYKRTKRMSNEQIQDARLDRIETKIDKLSDAMISLARTEEKILAMEENNRSYYDRLNKHSEKIDRIEEKVSENERTVSLINKIAMATMIAVIGTLVRFWFTQ